MLAKMQNIDRRIIYLIFFIMTAVPFVRPVLLPMDVGQFTQDAYNTIDALKPGDVVLVGVRYGPSVAGELNPPYEAILTHLVKKQGIKLLFFAEDATGPVYAQNGVKMAEAAGKKYGQDVVYLGFLAGEETAIAAISQDLHKAFPVESTGKALSELEVTRSVKNAKDITLIVNISSGGLGPLGWLRQATVPFGTKQVAILSQIMVPSAIPYYQAKQIAGILSGLQGAAEYEQLLKTPGRGMASMGAQTFGHAWLIFLVIISNLGYILTKGQKGVQK